MQKLIISLLFIPIFFTAYSQENSALKTSKAPIEANDDPFAITTDPFGGSTPPLKPSKPTPPLPDSIFDTIITKSLVTKLAKKNLPFTIEKSLTSHGNLHWQINFDVGKNPEDTAIIYIEITDGEQQITDESYQEWLKAWQEIAKLVPDALPEKMDFQTAIESSTIGYRMIYGWSIGPGGGGDSLIFTTKDRLFDISIDNSNSLSDDSKFHDISVFDLAQQINDRYVELAKE